LLLSSSKPSLGVFQLAGYLLHIPTSTWLQKFLSPLPCIKEEAFTPSSPRHHMVMKKASGDDSPLQQGARKSFWTLSISGRRRRWLAVCFMKSVRPLRVFPSKGIYRRRGDVRRWTRWLHHLVVRPGGGPRHPMVWLPLGPPPSLLWTPSSCQVNRNFGFHFVQFREYFMCNFFETQKQ
jgi:hypothetical protein